MKIQLYVTPALSGGTAIIRYRDGFYDRIRTNSKHCQDAQGFPVDQSWAKNIQKSALLTKWNRSWYGVSEDAEIYEEEQA